MKKYTIILIIIIGILILTAIVTSKIDYNQILKGNKPLFSFSIGYLKDGGTEVFLGLGYQLISWHQLESRVNNKTGYLIGTELCYFPMFKYWLLFTINFKPGIKLKFIQA
jgi:hypothetical protein